jgi:serine/threonine protein kinase
MTEEYRKERELGRGTYGTVYLASKPSPDHDGARERVAVKRLYTDSRDRTRHAGIVCLRELEMAVCYRHPNVASASRVLHASPFHTQLSPRRGYRTDKVYLEFPLALCDLEYALENQSLDPGTMKDAMVQLSRALAYLHSRGIVHRDVKPNNVLLYVDEAGESIQFRLGDFGAATVISAREKNTPKHYYIEYRAPELLLKSRSYGFEPDVWALGCVFVEIVTRTSPFATSESTPCVTQLRRIVRVLGASNALLALAAAQRVDLTTKPHPHASRHDGSGERRRPEGLASVLAKSGVDRAAFDAAGPPSWEAWLALLARMLDTDPATRATMPQVLSALGDCAPEPVDTAERTVLTIRTCPCRTEALRLLKLCALSEREYDHCVDLVNRVTYATNHVAKRLVAAVVSIVSKYWSIELAPSLASLLPKEIGRNYRSKALEEYELTLVRDVLEYRVYRPLLSDLVRGRVSRERVVEVAESQASNGLRAEELAEQLIAEEHRDGEALSDERLTPTED